MSARLAALLVFMLLVAGCDRFADEERGLSVIVQDESGNPLRGVEVHAVLHFEPTFSRQTSFPVLFTLDRVTGVQFEVARRSDRALVVREPLGLLGPGIHSIPEDDLDLPNGVYSVRVQAGDETVLDTDLVLNRVPDAYGTVPYLTVTPNTGQVFLSDEALSIGATATVQDGDDTEMLTATDSVTLVFLRPGHSPEARGVLLSPVGITRLGVRLK